MNTIDRTMREQGRKSLWVAKKLGVHPSSVSRWRQGKHPPTHKHRRQLAALLGITL